ncbi:MAG: sugar ABC transporter permease [Actinomycetaceae bacterium]|nr:sugar ABC transporter permease [Arcanobacterium sp.]MDD7505123.1 sugar ABC transporter permease [Actinomycetaceae bacterium]
MAAMSKARTGRKSPMLWIFLGPAIVILAVMIVYPAVYSFIRSLFDSSGNFIGLGNYIRMFSAQATLTAIKNNLIWVLAAPFICTILGLIFAVLMEKIKWKTAFRLIIFMPMAISMLAAGIIFRSIFQQNPEIGLANAGIVAVQQIFGGADANYPGARPRDPEAIIVGDNGAMSTEQTVRVGDSLMIPLVGISQDALPAEEDRTLAVPPPSEPDAITGTVWLDFARGGGGRDSIIDRGEAGLEGAIVQLVDGAGAVVAEAQTAPDGTFAITDSVTEGSVYTLQLPASNFEQGTSGINWLGPKLVTPVMILAFIWIWGGFAMVMIGAGLSAVDNSLMEAARTDGANEWQVFRYITVPQLLPTATVVFVTLIINVLKIFDLVYVIPPGESKEAGTVVAVEMWKQFGNFNYGMGSALAILLLVMVLPFMLYQVRNFRKGN